MPYERAVRKLKKRAHIYIADAGPCGFGNFAAKSFASGEIIVVEDEGDFYDDIISLEECICRQYDIQQTWQVGIDSYVMPTGNIDDLINHSCDPNCGIRLTPDGYIMWALRPIEAQEELTYDYSTYINAPDPPVRCLCGAANCRGTIGNFMTLPGQLRRHYLALGIVGGFVTQPIPETLRRRYLELVTVFAGAAGGPADLRGSLVRSDSSPCPARS